jgi:hypothetical protein
MAAGGCRAVNLALAVTALAAAALAVTALAAAALAGPAIRSR